MWEDAAVSRRARQFRMSGGATSVALLATMSHDRRDGRQRLATVTRDLPRRPHAAAR